VSPEPLIRVSREPGEKPLCSLSLDLDNQWSYMKTHGDPGWEGFPSYFDLVVPRVLEILERRGLEITFMVVGQDAALAANAEALGALGRSRHEVGSHSFHHEQWMLDRGREGIEQEIARAEEAIERATARRARGYRGPGFVVSPAVIEALGRRGYLYDASTFPSAIGPLARAYYLATSGLSRRERAKRRDLFGSFTDGLRPLRPYTWRVGDHSVVEIPVTTVPLLRAPFHVSYVLYLSQLSPWLGRAYFRAALAACRSRGVEPSVLLHPLDFLGREDVPALAFFPAMGMARARKLALVERLLDILADGFGVVTLAEHARRLVAGGRLAAVRVG
jgi:hypothetical protein